MLRIITAQFQRIIDENFNDYTKNKYLSLTKYKGVPLKQKLGSKMFYKYSKKHKLDKLVRLVFKLM